MPELESQKLSTYHVLKMFLWIYSTRYIPSDINVAALQLNK